MARLNEFDMPNLELFVTRELGREPVFYLVDHYQERTVWELWSNSLYVLDGADGECKDYKFVVDKTEPIRAVTSGRRFYNALCHALTEDE